ncbi:x-pro dipeptidyl-peptidase c-terminal non-catalytic domain-containing protein [Colletotrichum karsti]|uniref:X-pro dipeptidyl-peptidase c-terminal non-catalytic domain-containing protein n=1 Tax=Colletotrichum karsti TaxID=1095194 RepID=A0A9P6IEH0_9PEZI|nr:x-pro dipeptidyl-peptidase c-terminal non-catalytic domain-containing protein [Colletotrichum karsti]KAF9880406.1 x-pro dipeptidyl-peptidase c-terminal non-catalytic domain-containing protein [Colletotrichum karsti]
MAPYYVNSIKVLQCPINRPAWDHPKEPSRVDLPAGSRKTPEARPLPCDIILEKDHFLTLRDGVRIRADIYRPKTEEKVPAVLMWSPYGKSGEGNLNLDKVPLRAGVPLSQLSGYESFEGLDPAEWIPHGYALVNIDARGINDSEGDVRAFGTGEGKDGHDAVEEIAKLPWCTGKISLAGNSWLAICQWYIAVERPPHLACIAPFEGASDNLRESLSRGGIPAPPFMKMLQNLLVGRNEQEDSIGMLEKYPNCREYWDDKRAQMNKIEVPAYILASFSTMLHTLGSFRGFEEIPHGNKWIAVHATQEWYDLYSEARTNDLRKFFDRYLKGIENDWEKTPAVRLAVLGYNKPPILDLPFDHLPWLSNPNSQKLFLASDKSLQHTNGSEYKTLEYRDVERAEFAYTFQQPTKLAGPSKLVIHTSCPSQSDFDIYAQLRKRDKNGNDLEHVNMPLEALGVATAKEVPNINPLKYLGPTGRLRASKRKVAPELSQQYWETLAHDSDNPVAPGEILKLNVWIWPTAIQFDAGEQLVLKISGHDMSLPEFEMLKSEPAKAAPQILHLGGEYESYLEVSWLP